MVRSSAEIVQENRDYTLIPWSIQGAVDPSTCLIAPPLIITQEELDLGLDIVEEGLALVDQALTGKESEQ
jgi:4-aminobutyrate aminotransferase-like enzyme